MLPFSQLCKAVSVLTACTGDKNGAMKTERLKSDNRELYPKGNTGDNYIMEYRHIGCNSVKNSEKRNNLGREILVNL